MKVGLMQRINLALSGKIVDIYTNSTSYKQEDADPSIRLSPYTHQRYEELKELGYPIRIHTEHVVKEIEYKMVNMLFNLTAYTTM